MNPPCIRDLERFKKSGCPQKPWDGKEGCPAWIEMAVSKKGNPLEKEIRKQCIDIWIFEFQWSMLGLLEGNQQAIESFRNGMVQEYEDGKTEPKSDPAALALLRVFKEIQNKQRLILQYEATKQIKR